MKECGRAGQVILSSVACPALPHSFKLSHKGKGKAIPLESWTGPEGSRRLRLPNFKTIGI